MNSLKVFFLIWFLLIIGIDKSNAQIVKFIKNAIQAKYRVYITKDSKEASHWIYRVNNPADIRKPGDWYIVSNPVLFKNAMNIYEVKEKNEADFIIYFVSTKDSARIKY